LGDEAADGETEDIDLTELHGGEEGDGVVRHLPDDVRRGSGGTADPGVVECDDPPGRGQRVDQRGIPVVQVSPEVLEKDQRYRALARVAVRVVDAVRSAHHLVRKARVRSHHQAPFAVDKHVLGGSPFWSGDRFMLAWSRGCGVSAT
jgi:hypothetical protein